MARYFLDGCTIAPLSNYLKSLGILRIIAEQADPKITACWKNEKFVLETDMGKKEIIEFIQKKYVPTPILTPWSYNKYEKTVKNLENMIELERFATYKETIDGIKEVIEKFCGILSLEKMSKEDIDKKTKPRFLRLCRSILPDEAVLWIDAVGVLEGDKVRFSPILASGGNDGNYDMSENFVKHVTKMFSSNEKSQEWLECALFGGMVVLDSVNMIGHNPDATGSPTSGSGFEGRSLSNPWDYILMVEGMLLFAGSVAKRQSNGIGKAVFPFTTDASFAGYATSSNEECRGEIWMPLWNNPTTYMELTHVFNEGRAQFAGKQATTGAEFACAAITLGTERGITAFQRFSILQRKGKDYLLYVNAGKIHTADEPIAQLLNELDEWYALITKKSKSKEATATTKRLVRNFDESLLRFCKYQKKKDLLDILILVGKIERYASGYLDSKPLQTLSSDWIYQCYDESAEFRLAMSIASIRARGNVGSIRENLQCVTYESGKWMQKDSASFVWKDGNNLLKNMNDILQRRAIDGKNKSISHIPIDGIIPAKIEDVARFLNGEFDIEKINDLLLPLSIISMDENTQYPWQNIREDDIYIMQLPEAYMIIKLNYPPDPNEGIPYNTEVLTVLYAARINDGYVKAANILHSHGMHPKRYSNIGIPPNTSLSDILKERLMPSLLFPINKFDRKTMISQVVTDKKTQ